ncbi:MULTISPECIES: ATP-binding protein [unclassified Burkholderia]|uniref:ATP-binding protein n=1 Tax=unclassified Burkholderia TaxID=2613784 RepID=UPI002AB0BF73|nr:MULTISPECIES: ATP-binding protein [unclassified Burkholderia]
MYISQFQSEKIDNAVKSFEVALRSFIADVLVSDMPTESQFSINLSAVSISTSLIYSRRIKAKVTNFNKSVGDVYKMLRECRDSVATKKFNNDVPFVSEIIDLLLIFFNSNFSGRNIARDFPSIEEFHYCCTLFHKVRNNLSHPASHPVTSADAAKVAYFIETLIDSLDDHYFWYVDKRTIRACINEYQNAANGSTFSVSNLNATRATHNSLICREAEIAELYSCLLGSEGRQRLAGSVVLYGYGGVGKTAVTTEFLYRICRDKTDGKYQDIDFLLFFSSKDEYLKTSNSSGELYIDDARPEFSNCAELIALINENLGVNSPSEIAKKYRQGIVAIDNIENIAPSEKRQILELIKSLPRSIQFIVTSRNEEQCEEKIHIREFKRDSTGISFVTSIVESESLNVDMTRSMAEKLLDVSKGNALIIVQSLNSLHLGVATFSHIIQSLESVRSKDSEMIANFMYKNTFDRALEYLTDEGHPITKIMCTISLYDERIELYSISRLAGIGVVDGEKVCNYLLERLILAKFGEYYELNEFAKRFVFLKLLPEKIELGKLREEIREHKERMKRKLAELDGALEDNVDLHRSVTDWQPRNYIDKIVIAELFSLYNDGRRSIYRKDRIAFERYVKQIQEYSFITNHPYVALQRARLLKNGIRPFYQNDKAMLVRVEQAYEEALESIEYDYRYLIGTVAHGALLMLIGVFLCADKRDHPRAVRFLEQAKEILDQDARGKSWFIGCNFLSTSYLQRFRETGDAVYREKLAALVKEVNHYAALIKPASFDFVKYQERYSKFLKSSIDRRRSGKGKGAAPVSPSQRRQTQ